MDELRWKMGFQIYRQLFVILFLLNGVLQRLIFHYRLVIAGRMSSEGTCQQSQYFA